MLLVAFNPTLLSPGINEDPLAEWLSDLKFSLQDVTQDSCLLWSSGDKKVLSTWDLHCTEVRLGVLWMSHEAWRGLVGPYHVSTIHRPKGPSCFERTCGEYSARSGCQCCQELAANFSATVDPNPEKGETQVSQRSLESRTTGDSTYMSLSRFSQVITGP